MEPDKGRVGGASHADLHGTRARYVYRLRGNRPTGVGRPRADTCGNGAPGRMWRCVFSDTTPADASATLAARRLRRSADGSRSVGDGQD